MQSAGVDIEDISGQHLPKIHCCMCGTVITANPANMCPECLTNVVDITDGIPRKYNIMFCVESGRYLQPPNRWVRAELESPELLAICLKQIRGLSKVRLVDASFVWTEPHSRRIKVKLTVQKEVYDALVLQQTFVTEFVVHVTQSPEVTASYTEHTWKAAVQLRQKVNHKRTVFFLEQVILKHRAYEKITNIKEMPDGIDFFFAHRSHALQFCDFLSTVAPIRVHNSKELISHDASSNTYNYKYTFLAEIVQLCKDDIVVPPPRIYSVGGTTCPILVVSKISNLVQLVDPFSAVVGDINPSMYWKHPFRPLATADSMTEFTVYDVEPVPCPAGKFSLCDVQCAPSQKPDQVLYVRTHLGHILRPGDLVMGYDMRTLNLDEEVLSQYRGFQLPDVILVRKSFADRERRRRKRNWTLKRLAMEREEGNSKRMDADREARDFDRFMEELEEDPELRANVNLYRDPSHMPAGSEVGDDEEIPTVPLDELVDEMRTMAIDDDAMGDATAEPDSGDDEF